MTTARDLIEDAFHDLDSEEAETALEAFDAQFAFRQLKRMMSSFRLSDEMGWTPPANLDATLTIASADEEFVQTKLAMRVASAYDVPVPAQLREVHKDAKKDVYSRYVRLEPLSFGGLPGVRPNTYQDPDQNGYIVQSTTNVTSDYTIVLTDDVVRVDCSNGPIRVTLPAASSSDGYGFVIEKIDETLNQVIITPDGSDTVFGESDYRFNEHLRQVEVLSEGGTDWL